VLRYLTVVVGEDIDPAARESKELEALKIVGEAEEEDPFTPRRDEEHGDFGPPSDEFEAPFDEENL